MSGEDARANARPGRPPTMVASAVPGTDIDGPLFESLQINGDVLADGLFIMQNSAVRVVATDVSGVDRLEFKVDGNPIAVDTGTGPEYGFPLSIELLADGEHNLQINAYDLLGNQTQQSYDLIVNHLPSFDCFQDCLSE